MGRRDIGWALGLMGWVHNAKNAQTKHEVQLGNCALRIHALETAGSGLPSKKACNTGLPTKIDTSETTLKNLCNNFFSHSFPSSFIPKSFIKSPEGYIYFSMQKRTNSIFKLLNLMRFRLPINKPYFVGRVTGPVYRILRHKQITNINIYKKGLIEIF